MSQWPAWFDALIEREHPRAIVLFGQERPMHQYAIAIARQRDLPVIVFEEGYMRPSWITMEEGGVNGNSALMRVELSQVPQHPPLPPPVTFPQGFRAMAWYSFVYFVMIWVRSHRYPHYCHHKRVSLREAACWLRWGLRKLIYLVTERAVIKRLCSIQPPAFFIVPLQLNIDSQVRLHSDWGSNDRFIKAVIESFARTAPPQTLLVFKHHPLERGITIMAS
jgi:capsular polysaccharide export protein